MLRAVVGLVMIGSMLAVASPAMATNDNEPQGEPGEKITICHATGSETNPYVEITISVNGLNGHLNENHQGGQDIVPAPAGGCPGPVVVTPPPVVEEPPVVTTVTTDTPPVVPDIPVKETTTAVTGVNSSSTSLNEGDDSTPVATNTASKATHLTPSYSNNPTLLPYTGRNHTLVLLLGLALVAAGVILYYRSENDE